MIDALVVVVCWSLVLWLYCWAAGSLIGRAADRLDRPRRRRWVRRLHR